MGAYRGALSGVRPDDLAAHVDPRRGRAHRRRPRADRRRLLRRRQPVGRGQPRRGADGGAARRPADSVPGATVNRLCASGLEAVNAAARAVKLGEGDFYLAGGVESMSRAPWVVEQARARPAPRRRRRCTTRPWAGGSSTRGWPSWASRPSRWARPARTSPSATGSAARTRTPSPCAATSAPSPPPRPGRFAEEIVADRGAARAARRSLVEADEGPRPDASLEKMAALRPVFREGGTVTAGNASTLNDGAACTADRLRGRGRGARRRAAGPRRRLRRRRRRPRLHGHRPGRGGPPRPRRRRPQRSSRST